MTGTASPPLVVGRYAIFDRIAAGGMAAVHLGRLIGEGGFARTVAIKRLHPQFALDPEFVAMFLDEARLAARIRHPNVVPTVDIVTGEGELFLVMEYVDGESLSALLRASRVRGARAPIDVAVGVMVQALHGLHAAHEAKNDLGEPLDLVHRDVSPQNVLVGADGGVRVLDFGVAKALGKLHTTREGQLKGKLGYLSPEQVLGHPLTRRSDVFAASVVLWEIVAGTRLFSAESEGGVLRRITDGEIEPPSRVAPEVPPELDAVVMRGLAREPADRFDTALAMAEAIEGAVPLSSARTIGQWVGDLARQTLETRAQLVAAIESHTATAPSAPRPPAQGVPIEGEPQAQTHVSVVSDRRHAPARRWSWAWIAGAALGGAAVTAAVLGATHARGPVVVATPTATATATATPTATATTTPTPTATATTTPRAAPPPRTPKVPHRSHAPSTTPAPAGSSIYTRE